jgi:beta-glucosidase
MNRQYLDPVFLGSYPDELAEIFGEAWPKMPPADLEAIRRPIDFLGINYYKRGIVREDPAAWPLRASLARVPGSTYTETDWEVHAPALTDILLWVHQRYGDLPLYVTENGAAFYDPPKPREGRIDDPLRTAYLRDHLVAARTAIEKGVNLRGYFAWSLMDNLEWSLGFSKRFGIVHVDFETLERTPKASALFYRDVIRSNGGNLG